MGIPLARLALLVLALLVTTPLLAPAADACGVPCGRIYPSILIQFGEGQSGPKVVDAKMGQPVVVDAVLTFRFDATQDGYSAAAPNEPVFVTFEYPRKPGWVDLKVEPEKIEVPVNDPRFVQPTPDVNAPQAHFVFNAPIKVTATVTAQAVLKDGYDYQKLLVFAKSSESGLYQAGYGIKELRLRPEGALHESDVAGLRDVFTASPLPAPALAAASASFGGLTATVEPPASPAFWQPGTWTVKLDPVPPARVMLAMHDEGGNLVATSGPHRAAAALPLNATLAKPGLHTVTATLLPDAGTRTPPVTLAVDVVAGDLSAEGFRYEKSYLVQTNGPVPLPNGHATPTDALAQWERDVPFFAFDSAQAVNVLVSLGAPTLATAQFVVLDPSGKLLGQGSVDPQYPEKGFRLGSLPDEGWYVLRLRGAGSPAASTWNARIEVTYTTPPEARNRADGIPDETGGVLASAGRNLTLPVDELGVWQPSAFQPTLDKAPAFSYAITAIDGAGDLAYASGLRDGKASFTPTGAGAFRALVYAEPKPGAPFSPLVRAFTFTVGEGQTVTAGKFPIADEPLAPTSTSEGVLAIYGVPFLQGGAEGVADVKGGRAELVDEDGQGADTSAIGMRWLRVSATNAGAPKTVPVAYALEYDSPVTLGSPSGPSPGGERGALNVPGLAAGAVLAALGLVAVAAAFARR